MTDLRAEWRRFVGERLEQLSSRLKEVLRALIAQPYPPEVASLDFELFPDGFTDGFPARAFFMDAENNEFFVTVDGRSERRRPFEIGGRPKPTPRAFPLP